MSKVGLHQRRRLEQLQKPFSTNPIDNLPRLGRSVHGTSVTRSEELPITEVPHSDGLSLMEEERRA